MSSVTQRLDQALIESETLIQKITDDLRKLDGLAKGQRAGLESEIRRRLETLDRQIVRMKDDCRSLPPAQKEYFESEIPQIERQYTQLLEELDRKRFANDGNSKQYDQLLSNRDRSQKVTDDLDEAIRYGNDTITTGNVTVSTLLEDRKRIENIDSNLYQVHRHAQDGQTRAKRMLRRMICNSVLAWGIALLTLAALICIIVLKIKHIL